MTRRVHLVGIGGAGMSGIARILHQRGDVVTGSDQAASPFSDSLADLGVKVWIGHSADHGVGADVVVASSAVSEANVELAAARAAGVPVLRRDAFLPELTAGSKVVAVAGTHGKTTTTGWIAWVLRQAGRDPSFLAGGILTDLGANAGAGRGKDFVLEADEYDRTFLGLHPAVAVVTNVEYDHPDCYPTPDEFQAAFAQFANQVTELLIACADDPGAAALQPARAVRLTYGLGPDAEWRAEELRPNSAGGMDFLASRQGELVGLMRTRLPGDHNVVNALGALAAVDHLGVPLVDARQALAEFHGAARRFEVIGEVSGVVVIDDYAHHPSEIRATLSGARRRYPEAQIWAVFQPHTFSRTRTFLNEWPAALGQADHVVVTAIYAAREPNDPDLEGAAIVERMMHPDARYIPGLDDAAEEVLSRVRPGSVVLTMSAGDGNRVGKRVLSGLAGRGPGGGA
jgi:UDP-N-acetylmuramate--alanine ligase